MTLMGMLSWHNSATPSGSKDASCDTTLAKQEGNVLQLQSFRLGVEKVHHRDECGIQHSEDNKRAPSDVGCFSQQEPFQVRSRSGNLPKEIGVILTTANTAIQFHPEAMACILVRTRVVLISAG